MKHSVSVPRGAKRTCQVVSDGLFSVASWVSPSAWVLWGGAQVSKLGFFSICRRNQNQPALQMLDFEEGKSEGPVYKRGKEETYEEMEDKTVETIEFFVESLSGGRVITAQSNRYSESLSEGKVNNTRSPWFEGRMSVAETVAQFPGLRWVDGAAANRRSGYDEIVATREENQRQRSQSEESSQATGYYFGGR